MSLDGVTQNGISAQLQVAVLGWTAKTESINIQVNFPKVVQIIFGYLKLLN
jgi:hypothetical protein